MTGEQHVRALAEAIGQAVASALLPRLMVLEERLRDVGSRVETFVPRRTITDSVKERHRSVLRHLGGRCPCCGVAEVLDRVGAAIAGTEWDHFYSRERREFSEVWLLCSICHRSGMRDRHDRMAEFHAYQRRAAAIEGGQMPLALVAKTAHHGYYRSHPQ